MTDRDAGALLLRDAGVARRHALDRRPRRPAADRPRRPAHRAHQALHPQLRRRDRAGRPGRPRSSARRRRGDGWVKLVGDWIDRDAGDLDAVAGRPRSLAAAIAARARARRPGDRARASASESLPDLVGAGIDCIEHGTGLTDDLVAEMARRGTALVPTLVQIDNFPAYADQAEAKFPAYAAHMRDLHARRRRPSCGRRYEAGVPIYAGTDAGGVLAHGLIGRGGGGPARAVGLPPADALGAASWRARDVARPSRARWPRAPADFVRVRRATRWPTCASWPRPGPGRAARPRRRLTRRGLGGCALGLAQWRAVPGVRRTLSTAACRVPRPAPTVTPTRTGAATRMREAGAPPPVAVKIKLKRLGKIRAPYYRIVVADSRTKRDGRAIEDDRQVPPEGGPLAHRGRLRARAVLARRRRAADRAGRSPSSRSPATGRSSRACPAPAPLRVAEPKVGKKTAFEAAAKAPRRGQGRRDAKKRPPRRPPRRRGSREPAAAEAAEAERRPPRRQPRPAPREADAAEPPPRAPPPRRRRAEAGRHGRRRRGRGLTCSRRLSSTSSGASSSTPTTSRCATATAAPRPLLEVRVHPDDLGKVIGRNGRTAKALRTVSARSAAGRGVRVDFVDVDER